MARRSILALALAAALLCGCAPQTPEPPPAPPAEEEPLPAPPPEEETAPLPSGPLVQADWSRLEMDTTPVHPDVDGGRWYEEAVDHLIPREDYGTLYPYTGTTVLPFYTLWDEDGDLVTGVSSWANPVYGLMTRDGKIVTDPIYSNVHQPTFWQDGLYTALPVLMLTQCRPDEDTELSEYTNGRYYAVCAPDGSWCTDFDYFNYACRENELLLLSIRGVHRMDISTREEVFWSWEELGVPEELIPSLIGDITWLYGFSWIDEGVFLGFARADGTMITSRDTENWDDLHVRVFDPNTGDFTVLPVGDWDAALSAHWDGSRWPEVSWQYATPDTIELSYRGNTYTFPVLPDMGQLSKAVDVQGDYLLFHQYMAPEQTWLFRLSTGELVTQDRSIYFMSDPTQLDAPTYIHISREDGDTFYDEDFQQVAFFPAESDIYYSYTIQDGLLTVSNDTRSFACYELSTGKCIFYRNLDYLE